MAAEAAKPQAEAAPAEKEEQANCPACNKPIKRLRRYYRNGIFYCTKRCWIKVVKTPPAQEEK